MQDANSLRFTWHSYKAVAESDVIMSKWRAFATSGGNHYAFFQSPSWWQACVAGINANQHFLGIAHSGDGSVVGFVPVRLHETVIEFRIRGRRFWGKSLPCVEILGSAPCIPQARSAVQDLLASIWRAFPTCECVEMQNVTADSWLWPIVAEPGDRLRDCVTCIPREDTTLSLIELVDSFEAYLDKFGPKSRRNLKAEVRKLKCHGQGQLNLVRVDSTETLPNFLDIAASLSAQSRQYRAVGWKFDSEGEEAEQMRRLAKLGAVRSYYLVCGQRPCAYGKAFQHEGVFYYSKTAFDEDLARFSPGTVLLYLMIEDLFRHETPRVFSLFSGPWTYKARFATRSVPERWVLLLRPNVRNRITRDTHTFLRGTVDVARRVLGK